jgi:hypothetical protein
MPQNKSLNTYNYFLKGLNAPRQHGVLDFNLRACIQNAGPDLIEARLLV